MSYSPTIPKPLLLAVAVLLFVFVGCNRGPFRPGRTLFTSSTCAHTLIPVSLFIKGYSIYRRHTASLY